VPADATEGQSVRPPSRSREHRHLRARRGHPRCRPGPCAAVSHRCPAARTMRRAGSDRRGHAEGRWPPPRLRSRRIGWRQAGGPSGGWRPRATWRSATGSSGRHPQHEAGNETPAPPAFPCATGPRQCARFRRTPVPWRQWPGGGYWMDPL